MDTTIQFAETPLGALLKGHSQEVRSLFALMELETGQRERALIEAKDPQGDGAFYQRERIQTAAIWACMKSSGDLVEIGVLHGSTTVYLAAVARQFNRRVIAIDPFEVGTQNCTGAELPIFLQTIEPYSDVIDFMQMRSDDPRVIEALKARELAFAFVDGLHEFSAALGDLHAVSHAGVIALDDTRTIEEVNRALYEFWVPAEKERGRVPEKRDYWRESWIV